MARSTKYIFISGGVISSLGKGISAAAIGTLLELRGLKIGFIKLDPYINLDPGTMNPLQHGEVYVTQDGAETDMDLGHYERFTHASMRRANSSTAGQIYHRVIQRERSGEYRGGTVQVIPHITDEIQRVFVEATQGADVAIIEIGGTVGDIESLPFLEAVRQFRTNMPLGDVLNIHVTMVPYVPTADEMKTKPTQHSVAALRQIGIQADILLCRSEYELSEDLRAKLALFCNVRKDCIFGARDLESIYMMPTYLHQQRLDAKLTELLNIWSREPDLSAWEDIVSTLKAPKACVKIALVGKYVKLKEAYKSVIESLNHAGFAHHSKVEMQFIDSEELENQSEAELAARFEDIHGFLVPGGFGIRGTEGKIQAIRYARCHGVPLLGICLGMQLSVVEIARDLLGLTAAASTEFVPKTPAPVIWPIRAEFGSEGMGSAIRRGSVTCQIAEGSLAHKLYQSEEISERQRHRYTFNLGYVEAFERVGVRVSAYSEEGAIAEIIEIPEHPFFLCTQFHPEYQSKPTAAHPLFAGFIAAALQHRAL